MIGFHVSCQKDAKILVLYSLEWSMLNKKLASLKCMNKVVINSTLVSSKVQFLNTDAHCLIDKSNRLKHIYFFRGHARAISCNASPNNLIYIPLFQQKNCVSLILCLDGENRKERKGKEKKQ